MFFKYVSLSKKKTIIFGKKIGRCLKNGDIVVLNGNLGTGKTILVQGIASFFGINNITSPTFNIVKSYYNSKIIFNHIDAYRLEFSNSDIGLEEFFDKKSISIIEWPNFIKNLFNNNKPNLEIFIKFGKKNNERFFFLKTVDVCLKNKLKKIFKL